MLSVWWMVDGPVYWELLPRGVAITANRYCAQLDKVQQNLLQNGIDTRRIFFHQDNARPHTALQTLAKIEELGWTKLQQSPKPRHRAIRLSGPLPPRSALDDFFSSKPTKFYTDGIRSMREKLWKKRRRSSIITAIILFKSILFCFVVILIFHKI